MDQILTQQNIDQFFGQLLEGLKDLNIQVQNLECDHICYRCATNKEYLDFCEYLKKSNKNLLQESMIGGRPISTFENHVESHGYKITCLEVPSVKKGTDYQSGLEHAEFVIGQNMSLQQFIQNHQNVDFDTKAMSKEINPDVSVKIKNFTVKFHQQALYNVIKYEQQGDHVIPVPKNYFQENQ